MDFTGAQVSSEPQKGSGSNQTPVCWDKEQLGLLRAAPVMSTALDNTPVPPSHSDSLQLPGQHWAGTVCLTCCSLHAMLSLAEAQRP